MDTNDYSIVVESHEDENQQGARFKLPKDDLIRLSKVSPQFWFGAVALDWAIMLGTIFICEKYWNPFLYAAAVVIIGARQNALSILNHEGTHYRIFKKNRALTDLCADLLTAWPILDSTDAFRSVHAPHHRFLNTARDPYLSIWGNKFGTDKVEDWKFPSLIQFLSLLLKEVLMHSKQKLEIREYFKVKNRSLKVQSSGLLLFIPVIAITINHFKIWPQFLMYWIVPMFLIVPMVMRLQATLEHYAILGMYGTRTTVCSWVDLFFFLPWNIGYHSEHHFIPSIPFHNLREAHKILMNDESFRKNLHVTQGVYSGIKELTDRDEMARARERLNAVANSEKKLSA